MKMYRRRVYVLGFLVYGQKVFHENAYMRANRKLIDDRTPIKDILCAFYRAAHVVIHTVAVRRYK